MTNQEKKQFLLSYRDAVRAAREAEEELAQLQLSLYLPRSPALDGIGIGGGEIDLSVYKAQVQEIAEREVYPKLLHKIQIRQRIVYCINQLPSTSEVLVMRTRYLHLVQTRSEQQLNREGTRLLNWDEVAELCNYSRRHTLKIHGTALQHLRVI